MLFIFCFPRRPFFLQRLARIISGMLFLTVSAFSQSTTCPVMATSDPNPAETAYAANHFSQAKDLYEAALAAQPHNLQLSAAMVRILLRQGLVAQAAAQVEKISQRIQIPRSRSLRWPQYSSNKGNLGWHLRRSRQQQGTILATHASI